MRQECLDDLIITGKLGAMRSPGSQGGDTGQSCSLV